MLSDGPAVGSFPFPIRVPSTERTRDRHAISGSFGTPHEALQIADCRLQIGSGLAPTISAIREPHKEG